MSDGASSSRLPTRGPEAAEASGVFVKTLGCKVNQAESERIAVEILGSGACLVGEEEAAVVVVNTCTVTGEADAKARKAVRQALRAEGRPVVVVTGCLAALDPDGLRALGDRVVVEASKERVSARVREIAGVSSVTVSPSEGAAGVDAAVTRAGATFRTRTSVKIEDGCDAFCSYCIVPYARGLPRSVPLDGVAAEVASVVAAGAREVVVTGINLGRYDDRGRTLGDLVAAVSRTGIERVRLSSIEPTDLTDELLAVLAAEPSFCPHLHVPLQAGDDDVLRAMNRRYTTGEFARRLDRAREVLGPLAITADVIAGFPGETESQAENTARFCEAMGFARLHVFRYSERSGTTAASITPRVDPATRARRATRLREVDADLRRRYAESRCGGVATLLVERVVQRSGADAPDRPAESPSATLVEGTTEDYLRVRLEVSGVATDIAVGDLVKVRLTGYSDGTVSGAIASSDADLAGAWRRV